jgi:hypothetical protein
MEKTLERTKNGSKPGPRESDLLVELQAARELASRDRKLGWAALNRVFRAGSLPQPLSGEYAGEFVAVRVAPLFTQLVEGIASHWMPWKGKAFDASRREGINILSRDSLPWAHLLWPLYRDYREIGPHFYRAFPFATYTAPGLTDPDRRVFKIDYNLEPNPPLSVRRVLDELVQLSEDFYLGKAHVKWWWGSWQTVAFFSLQS